VQAIYDPAFPFADAMALADSIHVNVKVEDTADLPREKIEAMGPTVENEKEGYIKFAFPDGVNMIFSSIDISQDDRVESAEARRKRPFVDHIGIDIREDSERSREVFDAIPRRAARVRWDHVAQGGGDQPVYCCHVEVAAKHWVYPPKQEGRLAIPFEFAIGELKVHGEAQGCDLRPARPGTEAAQSPCCEG